MNISLRLSCRHRYSPARKTVMHPNTYQRRETWNRSSISSILPSSSFRFGRFAPAQASMVHCHSWPSYPGLGYSLLVACCRSPLGSKRNNNLEKQMGSFSIWHWMIVVILLVPNLMFIPAVKKTGFSASWVVLSFIPIVGCVLLWVWAYTKWPSEPER